MVCAGKGSCAAVGFALVLLGASAALAQPTRMYFSNIGSAALSRSATDGTGVSVVRSSSSVHGIAINPIANRMYLADATGRRIVNCATDGTACSTVIASAGLPGDIDLDLVNRHIYWVQFDDHTIRRANLDGSAPQLLVSGAALGPFGLALDVPGGKLYWAAFNSTGQVGRANLDGSAIENLSVGLVGRMRGVAVNPAANHLYWSDENREEIWRANLDGSMRAAIVSGLTGMVDPWGLELDIPRGHLYWVANGGVWRSDLDGMGAVRLVTATGQHSAFALQIGALPEGGACATSDACLNGRCVDGFCCESECTDFCMSCANADTGMPNGECHPGMAGVATDPTCVDGNPCTDDFCSPDGGCLFPHNTAPCEDGDFCSGPDVCSAGMCMPGAPVCDAGVDGGARDGGPPVDSGGLDASSAIDAALGTDSGSGGGADAATMDAGGDGDAGGCGCRATATGPNVPGWLLLGLLALSRRRR